MATIELSKVEKKFGDTHAVKPLDLTIKDGVAGESATAFAVVNAAPTCARISAGPLSSQAGTSGRPPARSASSAAP